MNVKAGGSKAPAHAQGGLEKGAEAAASSGERTNVFPSDAAYLTSSVVREHLLRGFVPADPFIGPDTRVVVCGSSFGADLVDRLDKIGRRAAPEADRAARVSTIGEDADTFALRGRLEWAWLDNAPPPRPFRRGADEAGSRDAARLKAVGLLDSADVFVLTLDRSEISCDAATGEALRSAVPVERLDPALHAFRVSTHHENLVNLLEIYKLIRQRRPEAAIVFALSPTPLEATFRPVSCLSANFASKAILRAALDEFLRAAQPRDRRLFYFPSYELVQLPFRNPFMVDRRRVRKHVLDFAMRAFERCFLISGASDAQIERVFRAALVKDALLGAEGAASREGRLGGSPEEERRFRGEARKLDRVAARLRDRAVENLARAKTVKG
ncbi:GSCFA domain-containing protein [Methylocella sp.]|uniref:GSCFA domain-containing protein n=1 Tax=Methylocella sp. TaxID=1978226 RepID=UPI003783673F